MVTCQDGFRISIQCGWGHYSSPKVSIRGTLPDSPSHFELGFPSKYEELLSGFAEDLTYNKNNLEGEPFFKWNAVITEDNIDQLSSMSFSGLIDNLEHPVLKKTKSVQE